METRIGAAHHAGGNAPLICAHRVALLLDLPPAPGDLVLRCEGAITGTCFAVATRATIGYDGVVLQKSNELGAVYKATQGKTGKASNVR